MRERWKMKLTPLSGVSLLWAWSFSFVLVRSTAFPYLMWVEDVLYLGSSLLVAFGCVAVFSKKKITQRGMLAAMAVASVLLAVSSVLIVGGENGGCPEALYAGKILAGPGQALSWVMWTSVISRFDLEVVESSFVSWFPLLGLFLGLLSASSLAGGLASMGLRVFLLLAFAGGSWWTFLLTCRASFGAGGQEEHPLSQGQSTEENCLRVAAESQDVSTKADCLSTASIIKDLGWLFCCLAAALAASMAVTSLAQGLVSFSTEILKWEYSLAAISMTGVAWTALRTTRKFGPASLYRWAVPVLVAGTALVSAGSPISQGVACFAFSLVAIGFEGMYHLLFVYLAHRYAPRRLFTASLGVFCMTMGGLIGSLSAEAVAGLGSSSVPSMLLATSAFVAIASLTPRSFVFSGIGGKVPAVISPENEPNRGTDSLALRTAAFSQRYGLTARESEVLSLLMQGRSRTFIRETLYISKGTVDTHINHIYKKAAVNSREALERLFFDASTT